MNCKNCILRGCSNRIIYIPKTKYFVNYWSHKRAVWEIGNKPGDTFIIRRLDECRDCGCEKAEPEEESV